MNININHQAQENLNNTNFYTAISPIAFVVHHSLDYIVQWMEQYQAVYFSQTKTVEEANQLVSSTIYYNQSLYIPKEQWFIKICRGEHNTQLSYEPNAPMIFSGSENATTSTELMGNNSLGVWAIISDQGYGIADNSYTLKGVIESNGLTNVIARKFMTLTDANTYARQRYTRRYNFLFPQAIFCIPQGDLNINQFYAIPNYEQLSQQSPNLMEWNNLIKRDMFL